MTSTRRKIALTICFLALLPACAKVTPPFEGTWNNSKSGTEGIWLFISKTDEEAMLVRIAVGRPDNFGPSRSAKVVDKRLILDGSGIFKELTFLAESTDTIITVNDVMSEIQFYRQR